MSNLSGRNFDEPDETVAAPKTTMDLINVGNRSIARLTLQPGWRWSEHVKPSVGTETCERAHLWYILSGRLRVRSDEGNEIEADQVFWAAPGHEGWVVGDEPVMAISLDELVN